MKFVRPAIVIGLVIGLVLAWTAARPLAQRGYFKPASGTCTIAGRITAADDGTPIPRADVRVQGYDGFGGGVVLTDDEGRFVFSELPAGRYSVIAGATGFVPIAYGEHLPGDGKQAIEVKAGESNAHIDVALPRGAVIDVTVTDETGEPQSGVIVSIKPCRAIDGRTEPIPSRDLETRGGPYSTNDLGRVRIYDLAPGGYCVAASPYQFVGSILSAGPNGLRGRSKYPTLYYPGTPAADAAQVVTLAVGHEEHLAMAVRPIGVARVTGRVLTDAGTPLTRVWLELKRAGPTPDRQVSGTAILNERGFEFNDVAPGDYVIRTRPSPLGEPSANVSGSLAISVAGEDLSDLVITATKAASLRGQVVYADDPGRAFDRDRTDFNVYLKHTDGSVSVHLEEDGRFTINGLSGGEVLGWMMSSSSIRDGGWVLKAVMLGDKDITDTPIAITPPQTIDSIRVLITQQHTIVDGSAPLLDYDAIIFSDDPQRWTESSRFTTIANGERGTFTTRALPPGRYRAVAVAPLGSERYKALRPAALRRLQEHAILFTLGEGEHKTITLPVATY